MTQKDKENVLHCLKVMIDEEVCEECNLYGTTGTDHCEADCVRMAIDALQTETCEDVISRREAINKAQCLELETAYDNEKVEEMLRELPPVQPKQKVGKWIKDRCGMTYPYRCTECNAHHRAMYNFCPSCGAKMEEGE